VYTQQLLFGVYGNLLRRSIAVLANYRVQFQTAKPVRDDCCTQSMSGV
jgi:hypothetical protein